MGGPLTHGDRVLAVLPSVSLLGLTGLVTSITLGFEEAAVEMLLASALLLALAPAGMLLHLAVSRELTPQERRLWFAGLQGRNGPALFASYFSARERGLATRRLAAGEGKLS